MKDQDLMKFERIVKGVAKKYESIYVSREDLEQELWIKVIEIINSSEKEVSTGLIAKSCFNYAVDFYRQSRRNRERNSELIDNSDNEDAITPDELVCKFDSGYDKVVIKDAIELFPKDSKRRKYAITKLYIYGELDENDLKEMNEEIPDLSNIDTESDISTKILKNNSSRSGSWNYERNNTAKSELYNYLGIIPNEEFVKGKSLDKFVTDRLVKLASSKGYVKLTKAMKDLVVVETEYTLDDITELVSNSKKLELVDEKGILYISAEFNGG